MRLVREGVGIGVWGVGSGKGSRKYPPKRKPCGRRSDSKEEISNIIKKIFTFIELFVLSSSAKSRKTRICRKHSPAAEETSVVHQMFEGGSNMAPREGETECELQKECSASKGGIACGPGKTSTESDDARCGRYSV